MPAAALDSNVLIALRDDDDVNHETSIEIVDGVDCGLLPTGRVIDFVVVEVLNLLHSRHSHQLAVDTHHRLKRSAGFQIEQTTEADFKSGVALFETYEGLSFVDAVLVAYMNRNEIPYLYSFDDDFDALDSVTRLQTDENPFGW